MLRSVKEINERLLKLLKDIFKEVTDEEAFDGLTDFIKDEINKFCQDKYDENFITLYGLYNHILGEELFKIIFYHIGHQYDKKIMEKVEEKMKLTLYVSGNCKSSYLNAFFDCIDAIIEDNDELIKKHIKSTPLCINLNHISKVHDYVKTSEYIDFNEFIEFMFGDNLDQLIECRLIMNYGTNENNKFYIKMIKDAFDNYLK